MLARPGDSPGLRFAIWVEGLGLRTYPEGPTKSKVSGPQIHPLTGSGLGSLKPYYLNTWSLRVSLEFRE